MTKKGRVSRHGADWVKSLSERESGALEEFQERGLMWQDSREWGQEYGERAVRDGQELGHSPRKTLFSLSLEEWETLNGF